MFAEGGIVIGSLPGDAAYGVIGVRSIGEPKDNLVPGLVGFKIKLRLFEEEGEMIEFSFGD